jgi:hypothetical protein
MPVNKKTQLAKIQIDNILHYGNLIVRIALSVVIISLTLSTVLLLVYGRIYEANHNTWYSVVIWYSLLGSMWIFMCSPVYLVTVAIYYRLSKRNQAHSIKPQFTLLMIAVLVATIFVATAIVLKKWSA